MYGIVVMSGLGLWRKEARNIFPYINIFAIFGLVVSLYHHFLQMFATSSGHLPCPVSGGDCAKRIIFEYGHITFPWMAALVFIEHNPGWQTRYVVRAADHRSGARDNLQPGDNVTIRELFRTALIASDNSAVMSLVRASGLSEREFVTAMNAKADTLRLKQTTFSDPTGLDNGNRSTPGDISRLAAAALSQADIREAVLRPAYSFATEQGSVKDIRATDKLLDRPLPAGVRLVGGKTGHIDEAGYCFVGLFEKDGRQVLTVVLGADSDEARFSETEKLVDWAYRTFFWRN